jgi:chorismate mutase
MGFFDPALAERSRTSGHKKPGLNKGSAGIHSVPGLFSELFNVAASRPAQMTTEQVKTSQLQASRQAKRLVNRASLGGRKRHGGAHGPVIAPWWTSLGKLGCCVASHHGTERVFILRRAPLRIISRIRGYPMSQPPPAPPSLAELRKEIDAIDEGVHRLLMQRGDIIDRLIQVKQTQEVGSAFRPAREADMMRRLVERHRGILPLDTVESIWRVIISTFTYVQAPFSVHADVSVGESAMRDSARFHFGFTVPYVAHFSATAAVEAVAKSKGDLALVSATSSRTPWWLSLEASGAPKIIARLPFVERADHPAALPVFVVSRVADSAMVTEVETWSVRVSGWNAEIARALSPLADIVAVPDTAFDGAALLVSIAGANRLEKIKLALIEAGASVRSSALVGSHATRYTVPSNGTKP